MDTVIVASSQFYSHYPKRIPKGTVNAEAVLIRLDSEWDGLTVRIHWLNVASNVERKPLLERDQPNTIPWEVLTDLGELRMGLVGLDGETVIKPTIWLTYGYVSDGVDPESGDDPQPPTPSWEQQMVEQAEAAANAAKEAKETADRLQRAAESGEFNGDPGPAGPPGKSPIIRNGTWWIWNNDSKDYTDTGVVASGGGGGTTDYNKLTNRPSIGGVLLEGDKTAQALGLQPTGDYATRSDIPKKLPNPYALTIKGKTYDGSQAMEVEVADGKTPNIQIGTVTTLEPGQQATASVTGTPENPLFNFGIPKGKTPEKGIDYFTEEDVEELAKQAAELVPGGGSTTPRLIADITVSGQGVKMLSEDIERIDDLYAVSVVITPPQEFNPNNLFVGFSTPGGDCQIAHINGLTLVVNKGFVISVERFTDFITSTGFLNSSYMWLNKTAYYAYSKKTWDGATSFYATEHSSGGFPEGTRIKVVGK